MTANNFSQDNDNSFDNTVPPTSPLRRNPTNRYIPRKLPTNDQASPQENDNADDLRIQPATEIPPNISHRRGLSESQSLLPERTKSNHKNSFEQEITKAFRYVAAPVLDDEEEELSIRRRRRRRKQRKNSDDIDEEIGGGSTPQVLDRSTKDIWRGVGVDICMFGASLPFFGLLAWALWLNGREVEEDTERAFGECAMVAATFFPIVFAMVVSRAIFKFASWKLEKGATVGPLEQLLSSRTFSSALITQIRLRTSPFLGLGLVFLWLFSPVGSQGALRMLVTELKSTTEESAIRYLNTRRGTVIGNEETLGTSSMDFKVSLAASLLTPPERKTGPTDMWGNVKIPLYSSLANVAADKDDWRIIPSSLQTTYTSLFGIPISSRRSDGNATFSLESTYIELNCSTRTSNLTRQVNSAEGTSMFIDPGLISTGGLFRSSSNITSETNYALGYLGQDITRFLSPGSQNTTNSTTRAQGLCLDCLPQVFENATSYLGVLLLQDFTGDRNVTSIYCGPRQYYVESKIQCSPNEGAENTSENCEVIAQRESKLEKQPSGITMLSFKEVAMALSAFVADSSMLLDGKGIDMVMNYLVNPLDNEYIQSRSNSYRSARKQAEVTESDGNAGESQLLDVPLRELSARFSQVINAYLYGLLPNSTHALTNLDFDSTDTLPNTDTSNDPIRKVAQNPSPLSIILKSNPQTLPTTRQTTILTPKFTLSPSWLALFLLSTTILPLAAITASLFRQRTLSRDYIGYVSSHVVQSQGGGRGGVRMDGLLRAKAMRDEKVMLGEVGEVEGGFMIGTGVTVSVGRLGVGFVDGGGGGVGKLRRGRMYL